MNQNVSLFAAQSNEDTPFITRRKKKRQFQQLELLDTDPIKLTMSVIDVYDPFVKNSNYSKTFLLPHTPLNGKYFKSVFNVNNSDFDATTTASAYILIDGTFFTAGTIALLSVKENLLENTVFYEIVFIGTTSSLSSDLNASLCELDLGGTAATGGTGTAYGYNFNHTFNYDNVTSSWDVGPTGVGGLLNGDVLYPLIEWGYTYGETGPNISVNTAVAYDKFFEGGTGPISVPVYPGNFSAPNGFNREDTALKLGQMKPALRLKSFIDGIFNRTDFTFESEFLNSESFKTLYLITEGQSRPRIVSNPEFNVLLENVRYLDHATEISFSDDGLGYPIPVTSEFYDYDRVVASPGVFIVPQAGDYDLSFNVSIKNYLQTGATATWVFKLVDISTDTVIDSYNCLVTDNAGCTYPITDHSFADTYSLIPGQQLRIYLWSVPIALASGYCAGAINWYTAITSAQWQCTGSNLQNLNLSTLLRCDITMKDFIKSVADKFNLIFEPSKTIPNHFIIEPWNDWITLGEVKDWSKKLDISQDFKTSPAFYTQKRFLNLADKLDLDFNSTQFKDISGGKSFGEINLDSGIPQIVDTRRVESLFSSIPLTPIAGSPQGPTAWLIPHLAKYTPPRSENDFGKIEPILPAMRIAYYNGKRSTNNWFLEDEVAVPHLQNSGPQVSSFSDWNVNNDATLGGPTGVPLTSYDLHWGNSFSLNAETQTSTAALYDTSVYTINTVVQNTNFNVYWKNWFDNFLNFETGGRTSRIGEVYLTLNSDDIRNLRFNDKIWIRNSYWMVIEIKDWEIGRVSKCKVKLLKIDNLTNNQNLVINECASVVCYEWLLTSVIGSTNYSYIECSTGDIISGSLLQGATVSVCSCSSPSTSQKPPFVTIVQGSTCS